MIFVKEIKEYLYVIKFTLWQIQSLKAILAMIEYEQVDDEYKNFFYTLKKHVDDEMPDDD